MENGNEKHNKVVNQSTSVGSKQQTGQWRTICGADQRFYFVNLKTKTSHWLPPPEFWSSNLGLPYGWEAGINENNSKYYINHVNQSSTLEDPRSEADQATHLQMATPRSRKVQIKRDPSMGFGFVAGSEKPVVIRSVISGGPSYGRLYSNDQILKVNGTDVSSVAQERVINLIKSCVNELEMHVVSSEDLQDAKNQGKRRSSLMSRATRERRRSSPVNVRFADDIVQYIGPAEQARRGSLPVIPNVLKVFLENGQTRSFHFNTKTTIQEIFTSLGNKLDIKAMEHFSLILSGPQRNQLSFIQNHEKVSEVYLNRNCSRASWVCKLRICFLPRDTNELLEKDPVAFDYLYDQITKDVVEGLFEVDLRYDLAIRLAALHMQQRATEAKRKVPTKLSVKNIEKDFDGLEHFIPENIINGVKLKDLRKVLEQQIKLNQSLSGLGQRYLTSNECKQQYLKLANDLVSYGGKYFNVILFTNNGGTSGNKSRKAKQQEAAVLVSPKYGLSQMVKGKINVLCQLADLEQISGFSISFHAEGKRLLKISVNDNKDTVLLVKPLDSMDLVTFIIGYQKLWKTTVAMLTFEGETQEPLAPITDTDIPPYETVHRVFADSWSYPSLLQVPGSNSEHHFYVDLSEEPPKYSTSNKKSEKISTSDEGSSIPVDNNNVAVKRSSDSIADQDDDGKDASQDMVPEKRPRVDGSNLSDDLEEYNRSDAEDLTVESAKGRTLYVIAEEGMHSPIIQEEEEDYISQLALAEEMWRQDRKEEKVTLTDVLSNDDAQETSETFGNVDINSDDESMDSAGEISNIESQDVAKENVLSLDDASEICDIKSDSSEEEQIDTKTNEPARTSDDVDETESSDESTSDPLTADNMDVVVLDEDSKGTQCLDINDIEFDDRSAEPAGDSLCLLADFSFMGESIARVDESSAVGVGNLRGEATPDDVKDDIDSGELLHPNTSQVSSSSDQNDEHFTKNYLQKFETSESVESNEADDHFNSSGEIIFENSSDSVPFDDLNNSTMNENATENFGAEILNVNVRGNSSRSGEISTTRNSDEEFINNNENNDKDAEKDNRTSAGEDSTDRIRLDSIGPSGGYPVCLSQKAAALDSDEDKDAETDSTTGSSKDSDLSSLTSHEGSLQFVGVNADSHQDDVEDKDIPNTDLSSVVEHNLAEQCGDEKMRLEKLTGSNLPATLEESLHHGSEYSSSEKPNGLVDLRFNSIPLGQRDSNDGLEDAIADSLEDNSDESSKVKGNFDERKVVLRTERVNVRDETPENNTRTHVSETVNHKDDTTDTKAKASSSVVLFLGNEPGESDDTSGNIYEEGSFRAHLEEGKGEFLQFSLMDWIIPPPPGSTEELLDSEITVASPPPLSPSAISSPTVELSDNMFNEFEIDGLILPPPPLGSSLNSIIKIVSPPPMHLKRSIGEEIPAHNDVADSVHSSTKMLNHLTLDDDEVFPVDQAKNKTVPSSESSASSLVMDFDSDSTYNNNGSMISFYSLSNDSQMTSEDENFHEEKEASFGQIQNQNVESLEQNLSIGSIESRRTSEKPLKESQEDDDGYDAEDKTVQEFPEHARRNGGPYHGNDYDFLDDLVAHSSDDNTSTLKDVKGTKERRVQDKTNRNVRKASRKDVSLMKTSYDDVDDLPRDSEESGHDGKVMKSGAVHLPLSHPSHAASFTTTRSTGSTKGDVRSRVNRFNKIGKPRNPVELVQTDTTSRTFLSLIDVLKSTDIDNPEEFVGEADAGTSNDDTISHPDRTKHGNSDSSLSKLSINIKAEPSDALAFSLPSHSKEPELNPSRNLEDVSMGLEFDSKKDGERTSRFTRKLQIKSNKSRTSSLQSDKKTNNTEYVLDDDVSSPNDPKSARLNSGDKNMAIENTDSGKAVEGDDSVPKSFYGAKTGITDLTDRLKLRLQGCLDDCQDAILKSSPYSPYTSNTNWKDGVLNNARFFSSDIKTLNTNVQEMNGEVETAMLSSQETLQSLVSSFVLASSTQYKISLYSMRILAGILSDVISQYDNIVSKIEEVVRDTPDKSKCKSVAKETVAMTTLISSLSRTLKRL